MRGGGILEIEILNANCLDALKLFDDNSVDSVVTDPPYGLAFMNKKWDYDVPSKDIWCEVIRVLKPGGYLLSFGGTRTYHRMVVAIEDAGFEIRDQIQWIYGSGFPKSHNVAIGIDKQANAMGPRGRSIPTARLVNQRARRVDLQDAPSGWTEPNEHKPITDDAKQWQGWGTALKPANEPIVLARKPLSEKTVAANVLKWGVGGLNIDASRIGEGGHHGGKTAAGKSNTYFDQKDYVSEPNKIYTQGRWPANVLFDESAAEMLDEQSGFSDARGGNPKTKSTSKSNVAISPGGGRQVVRNDFGGASRFFYVAKASKRERNAGLEGMPEIVKPLMGEFKNNPGRETPKSSPTARAPIIIQRSNQSSSWNI